MQAPNAASVSDQGVSAPTMTALTKQFPQEGIWMQQVARPVQVPTTC